MSKFLAVFIHCFALFFSSLAADTGLAKANGIEIWYETFGEKKDPALLLVMGGCSQGILWPVELCEKIVENGFYVIRYDHRDAGFSTCFDFEKGPYDLLDMAKDAVGLLDFLEIGKAHVFGMSMGGPITELIAVNFPERVETMSLMATSCDFRPLNLALAGLPLEKDSLSGPAENYVQAMNEFFKSPPKNEDEKLEQRVAIWRLLNGSVVPLEENHLRDIHRQFLSRLRCQESLANHILAIKRSEELVKTVPQQVKVPTLIFHGSEDPIFRPDHGLALAQAISGSKVVFIKGMGHVPNAHFFDLMVKEIKQHSGKKHV